jgi:hypothetical protein
MRVHVLRTSYSTPHPPEEGNRTIEIAAKFASVNGPQGRTVYRVYKKKGINNIEINNIVKI